MVLRSLAARLVTWYVLVAVALVGVATAGLSAFAFSQMARSERTAVNDAAREAPELAALYTARSGSLAAAAPEIIRHLRRSGIRVYVVDERRQRVYDGDRAVPIDEMPWALGPLGHPPLRHAPPKPAPPFVDALFGVHPQHAIVPGGAITILPDSARMEAAVRLYWCLVAAGIVTATVIAWLFGRSITGQALRPLVEVTTSLERFAQGDFTPHAISASVKNELGRLATAYNAAAAQVSAAFAERRRTESQMRQFIADAGHELRTPLTVLIGYTDVLAQGGFDDPALRERIFETMRLESARMQTLIDKLILLARLEQPERPVSASVVDLAEIAKRVVVTFEPLMRDVTVRLSTEPDALVRGDEAELYEAIANVVDNARKHATGADVDVRVETRRDAVAIVVRDTGPGMTADEQQHAFDRFYRGEARGEVPGSGLGLAIVRRAVERAGGAIALDSRPGSGTRVTIRLPRVAAGTAGAPAR